MKVIDILKEKMVEEITEPDFYPAHKLETLKEYKSSMLIIVKFVIFNLRNWIFKKNKKREWKKGHHNKKYVKDSYRGMSKWRCINLVMFGPKSGKLYPILKNEKILQ